MICINHLIKGMRSEDCFLIYRKHGHVSIIFKSKQNGINRNLLKLLADFEKEAVGCIECTSF